MNQSESINDISMYFSIFFNVSQLISTYFCDLIISDQRIYGNLHVHPRAGQLPGPAKKDCHSCWRVCRRSWRSARRPPIQSLWRFLWMGGTPKSSQSLDHISTETDWNPWFWGSPISGNPHIYRPDALKLYKPFAPQLLHSSLSAILRDFHDGSEMKWFLHLTLPAYVPSHWPGKVLPELLTAQRFPGQEARDSIHFGRFGRFGPSC